MLLSVHAYFVSFNPLTPSSLADIVTDIFAVGLLSVIIYFAVSGVTSTVGGILSI